MSDVVCELCGCHGNESCGHRMLGADCSLSREMICPCCILDVNHMRHIQEQEDKQMALFEED